MRRSVFIPNMRHGENPIPAASVVRNVLESGAIFGSDTISGVLADNPEMQCANVFSNTASILEAAGATFTDVVKMTFYVQPDFDRTIINREWLKAFPDPASMPARHVLVNRDLPSRMHVQGVMVAVLGAH